MKPTVYIETSVVGYLTCRLSKDPFVAGHMVATRKWWMERREAFELFVSDVVVTECSQGDSSAARDRLDAIAGVPILPMLDTARQLSHQLVSQNALPARAYVDAAHIAIAATNSMQYLLTWNCKHIANAQLRSKIETTCRDSGYNPPILCTPYELQEVIE